MKEFVIIIMFLTTALYLVVFLVIFTFILLLGAWIALKSISSVMASNRNMQLEYREMKQTIKKQKPAKILFNSGIFLSSMVGTYYIILFVLTCLSSFQYSRMFADFYESISLASDVLFVIDGFAPIASLLLAVISYIFFARGIYINTKCIKMIKRRG